MSEAARHCLELVRAGDKDRFLASLFVPEVKRPLLLALYAFNIEIARIPALASEPRLGEIRRQWWFDTLDQIERGEAVDHPVAGELARAIKEARLPVRALKNLIEARQFDLHAEPMPSLESLEAYLGETSSALIQMSAISLGGADATAIAEPAGLAGVAYGLARLLCSGRARPFLPRDLVDAHGEGDTLTLLASHALTRLREARHHAIPTSVFPAFLATSLTDLYLDRLAAAGPDALNHPVEVPQLNRQWCLWRMARKERF